MTDYQGEGNMTQDFDSNNAGDGSTMYNDIPDYTTCDDKTRAVLDEIIETVDPYNPEDMGAFGDETLANLQDVTDRIITAMMNEEHGAFREPMKECVDDLKDVDLETLQEQVGRVMSATANTVKDNKGATALAVTGLLTGQFWLTLASGGTAAGKQYLKKHGVEVKESIQERKLVRTDQSNSMEAIEDRLRSALMKSNEHIRKLQFAQKKAPELVSRINEMARANRDAYYGTTLYIGAGREIARRIGEELLPQARSEFEQTRSFDAQTKIDTLAESTDALDHKLQILEQARTESVLSTQNLADMKTAINDNRHSLQSLLTSEVPQWKRTLATAGMAVETYRTTSVTEAFRDHLERVTDDSVRAAKHAMDAAEKGRIGDPERVQRVIERTIAFRAALETRHEALEQMSEVVNERRQQLIEETNKTLVAQARHTERELQRQLEGPKAAGQAAALPNASTEQDNVPGVRYGVNQGQRNKNTGPKM